MCWRTAFLTATLLVLPASERQTAAGQSGPGASICDQVTEIPKIECEALVALYEATDGPNWPAYYSGWMQTPKPCSWVGIQCKDDHVVDLSVGYGLKGTIPPELGNLTHLWRLSINEAQLTGGIPPELGNLTKLRVLYLYGNGLTGNIPPALGQLTSLESLSLRRNRLTGDIPPDLSKLDNMSWLDLSANELTGPIPAELGSRDRLGNLNLSNNQLTGGIPAELGTYKYLYSLWLNDNPLTGSIPLSFTRLHRIDRLYLQDTNLCRPSAPAFGRWLSEIRSYYVQIPDVVCSSDATPPACGALTVHRNVNGQAVAMEVSPSDPESGIAAVLFQRLDNTTSTINGTMGPYTQGEIVGFPSPHPGSVTVRIDKIDVQATGVGVIFVDNGQGMRTTCDPVYETIEAELPTAFTLEQNHPNPFNPTTRIRFQLPEAAPVRLSVYDVLGRRVAVLIDEAMEAGTYDAVWDGLDEAGALVPSGMYLYRIEAGAFVQARTMLLVK